jgi:hypothetical protein
VHWLSIQREILYLGIQVLLIATSHRSKSHILKECSLQMSIYDLKDFSSRSRMNGRMKKRLVNPLLGKQRKEREKLAKKLFSQMKEIKSKRRIQNILRMSMQLQLNERLSLQLKVICEIHETYFNICQNLEYLQIFL